jgi:hypothetical protein
VCSANAGSAAAISKKKNLAPSAQRFNNLHRDGGDQQVITGIGQQHCFNCDVTLDARTDQVMQLLSIFLSFHRCTKIAIFFRFAKFISVLVTVALRALTLRIGKGFANFDVG